MPKHDKGKPPVHVCEGIWVGDDGALKCMYCPKCKKRWRTY